MCIFVGLRVSMIAPIVVFVHLGNQLPRWLIPSILDFKKSHDGQVYVILNNKSNSDSLRSKKISTWIVDDKKITLPDTLENKDLYYFRNGFWRESTRRFWALKEFQKDFRYPIIHFESDVKVFKNFPYNSFLQLDQPIAFPLSAPGYGVASVFYSREFHALDELLGNWGDSSSQKKLAEITHFVNDMTLLGSSVINYPYLVTNLPTVHPKCNCIEHHKVITHYDLSANFKIFSGVFDGATLGQFLFGFDARNERGLRRLYKYREYHTIRPNKLRFEYNSSRESLLMNCNEVQNTEIFNLHIHSKDLRVFSDKFSSLIVRRTNPNAFNLRWEFDAWALMESIIGTYSRIKKEIRKLLH